MEKSRRLRYQVLGPVELFADDVPVRLGGPKQRAVLALLLLNANRVVAEHRFLTMVWGDDPPLSVRGQLQMYVSQLRKLIGAPVIVRRPPGYLIRVEPGELDLQVFAEKALQARADLAEGQAGDALAGFESALALWHGPALGGVTARLLDDEGPALSEQRLGVLEDYFDALLAAGEDHRIEQEVRAAAGENPLRERLQSQLMLMLHRSGRTAEALDLYTSTRSRLVAEKGAEPGPRLREVQMRLLRDADEPAAHAKPARPPKPAPTKPANQVPRQLPADVPVFAGRVAELADLDALLGATATVVIGGGAGVGKTTLAVRWAHRVEDRFPDGQLYMNLRGFDPSGNAVTAEDVVRAFLTAFDVGVPATEEAQFSLYRNLLADKRVLVVLDNARDAEQVRPLLPAAPGCLTVVTSRNQLPSLIAADGAMPVVLDLLSPSEARETLARRVGAARVEAEPQAVADIADLCVRLPLALAIVAARAATNPSFSLASLADELRETRGNLDVFDVGDPAASVRAVFSWSYLTLTERSAKLFRLLAGNPGPHVAPIVAASMLGEPVRQARAALAELARAQLIIESAPGRYGFHDLLRAYAGELAETEDTAIERRAAIHRTLDHYLHSAAQADRVLRPQKITPIQLAPVLPGVTVGEVRTQQQAAEWFASEHTVLHAAVEQAARHGFDAHAWQLTHTITAMSRRLGELSVYETALAAARRLGEPLALALSHRALAVRHLAHGRLDDAETDLTASLGLLEQIGDIGLLADLHQGLGAVCAMTGRHTQQREHTEKALELFRTAGNQNGVATSYSNLAWCFAQEEDYERAFTLCKQALEILEDFPDRGTEANTWDTLGYANLRLGHDEEAIACYQRAIELDRKLNSRAHEADVHRQIGDIHHDRGATTAAREEWLQALEIVEELRLTARADELRERLARPAE